MIGNDPSSLYLNRLLSICELLGSVDDTADLLGESVSKVERWLKSGQVAIQSQRVVLDLEFLLVRASHVWSRETLMSWFRSENSFIGASPIHELRQRGPVDVLAAIIATETGSYT